MAQDAAKPVKAKTPGAKPGGGAGAGNAAKGAAKAGAKAGAKTGPKAGPKPVSSGGAPHSVEPAGEKLRRKDLIEMVATRADLKRNVATAAIEATLAIIAEALLEGRQLALPPLGTMRVSRVSDAGKSKVMVVRLRQGTKQAKGAKDTLAEPDEAE